MTESAVGAGAVEQYLDELLGADVVGEVESASETSEPEPQAPEPAYLVIQVAGVRFAVPNRAVRCVHENIEGLMPGMSSHALLPATADLDGIMTPVLDLALLMMPAQRLQQLPLLESRAPYLVELAGVPFALSSEIPRELTDIDADRVQWRGPNGQRVWLAGTCPDLKIAILDLDGLNSQLS